jgi:peptide/nickel transport system permease protein
MFQFAMKRLITMLPAIVGVVTLTFLLVHLVPGDPVDMMLGEQASQQDRDSLRRELGLDLPLLVQYKNYVTNLLHLDMGRSLASKDPVLTEIASRFPATFKLSLTAMLFALAWGIPLGVMAAVKQYSWMDNLGFSLGLFGMSIPGVFLGPLLIYVFAIKLDWFPVSESGGLEHLILPALSLAVPLGSVIFRMSRASLLEVVQEDYIRTARSKGLTERRIYFKHALRNSLIPIVTIVGLQTGALLTGTVITETIFDWPGVGTLLYGAIQRRDYPVVQGCVLFVACTYLLVNLITDLMYGVVNPKVRVS